LRSFSSLKKEKNIKGYKPSMLQPSQRRKKRKGFSRPPSRGRDPYNSMQWKEGEQTATNISPSKKRWWVLHRKKTTFPLMKGIGDPLPGGKTPTGFRKGAGSIISGFVHKGLFGLLSLPRGERAVSV